MSSSISNSRVSPDCRCNKKTKVWTSWTPANPGRRFRGCEDWEDGGCDFFAWEDPPIPRRTAYVIRNLREEKDTLLKEKDTLMKEVENLKNQRRKWKMYFIISWCLIVLLKCLGFV
ncbi:GRF zinc finger family protein [Striga asiatica]|uniref:GRF zinc finger family protein n=1 Tax=Striga asiatica TaxID=4170 RepID=A0A5A7NYQ1_STRAF|nr:GRF zinc finger family protein [Striga asiatica]